MRQNRLTSTLTPLAIVLMLLFGAAGSAMAKPNRLLQSEERFRDQLGDRAVPIAKGVYQVDLPSGERVRVAFGRDGMKQDIAWLRAEISTLEKSEDPSAASRLRLLTRALAGLEKHAAEQKDGPRSITANSAVQGSVCSNYFYYLDGGHNPWLVGGTTWGEAGVGLDGDGFEYRCVAYSYVGTTDGYNNYSWDEDTSDEIGFAYATASVDCGSSSWYCPTWESYNWSETYACSNSFRSIYRSGTNP